jgi:hypothetical protein
MAHTLVPSRLGRLLEQQVFRSNTFSDLVALRVGLPSSGQAKTFNV